MYSARELLAKRCFDVAASTLGLLASAPVLAVTAALVKASSPGPVLFRQQRVGLGGQPFELWKFRTMRVGGAGPQVTADGDTRITRVGRLLRKSKLDELPELFNVLRGDLSLVGPRPEVAKFVAHYPADERRFLQRFRPGITDPATIRFRNEEDILARAPDPDRAYLEEVLPQKLRMYREYLEGASFLSDLGVLSATVKVVLRPNSAPR
jgi:lipopolysaccharide/colanic/teichoic acid biosynthesis glycosyltransferase